MPIANYYYGYGTFVFPIVPLAIDDGCVISSRTCYFICPNRNNNKNRCDFPQPALTNNCAPHCSFDIELFQFFFILFFLHLTIYLLRMPYILPMLLCDTIPRMDGTIYVIIKHHKIKINRLQRRRCESFNSFRTMKSTLEIIASKFCLKYANLSMCNMLNEQCKPLFAIT